MGKGSRPRPIEIDKKQFESNWDRIFNKNKKTTNNPESGKSKGDDK